jgi:hypothetical protein
MKHPISKRYGGKSADGRRLIAYSWSRSIAHQMLRAAGVIGRIRRLRGRVVRGRPELPAGRVEIDLMGKYQGK